MFIHMRLFSEDFDIRDRVGLRVLVTGTFRSLFAFTTAAPRARARRAPRARPRARRRTAAGVWALAQARILKICCKFSAADRAALRSASADRAAAAGRRARGLRSGRRTSTRCSSARAQLQLTATTLPSQHAAELSTSPLTEDTRVQKLTSATSLYARAPPPRGTRGAVPYGTSYGTSTVLRYRTVPYRAYHVPYA